MMYGRSSGDGWEGVLAAGLFGVVVVAALAVAAVVVTTLVILLTEIARVYQARAVRPCRSRPILWAALALLLTLWLLAGLLTGSPQTARWGVYLGSWSFLAFVVVIEGCDMYEQRFDPPQQGATEPEVTVDQLLQPWQELPTVAPQPAMPVASSNGHHHSVSV